MKEIIDLIKNKEQEDIERIIFILVNLAHFIEQTFKTDKSNHILIFEKIRYLLASRYGDLVKKADKYKRNLDMEQLVEVLKKHSEIPKSVIENKFITHIAVLQYAKITGMDDIDLMNMMKSLMEHFFKEHGDLGKKIYLDYMGR